MMAEPPSFSILLIVELQRECGIVGDLKPAFSGTLKSTRTIAFAGKNCMHQSLTYNINL